MPSLALQMTPEPQSEVVRAGLGEWGPHSVHAATPSAHMRAQAGLRRVEGEGGVVQIAGTGHGRPLAATPMLQGRRPAVLPGPTGASRGGRADAAAAYLPGGLGRWHGQHSTLLEVGKLAEGLPSAVWRGQLLAFQAQPKGCPHPVQHPQSPE